MTVPEDGLLGHWTGEVKPGGRVYDRSPEGNHGVYGPAAKWVWFTNPRAVRYVGEYDRTHVGYLGGSTGRDPVVGTYDHDTGRFAETVLASDVSNNDHVGPAIWARSDGHLVALWSLHNGPWLRYRMTETPEDPSSFGPVREFEGAGICYPNPVQPGADPDPEDPIYLFYRDRTGTGDGHPYYRVSTDGGETFENPTRLITAPDGHFSVYWMAAQRDGEVHLFFTDAEGGGTGPKWDVSYARFDAGALSTASGETIATPADLPVRVDDLEVLYDASEPATPSPWIWDSGVDAEGNPAAVYATFPTTQSHEYRYVRRVDGEWRDRKLVDAGRYVGVDPNTGYYASGAAMPEHDPDVVYAAVERGGQAQLRRFETGDRGETFAGETVTTRATADQLRPVAVRNGSPECPVVWIAGAYNSLDASQTVLRGPPGDLATGGPLVGDGSEGVSLGVDCYDAAVFGRGLTIAAAFETDDPGTRQCLLDFGGALELWLADGEPGTATLSLAGDGARESEDAVSLTCDGVTGDGTHVAVASWDGESASLTLDGPTQSSNQGGDEVTTAVAGPLALGGTPAGWTLGKPRHLDGPGVVGTLCGVTLYNRALEDGEANRLRDALR
jgi:hypothetical protein